MKVSINYHFAERNTLNQTGVPKRRVIDTKLEGLYQGLKSVKHIVKLFRRTQETKTQNENLTLLIDKVIYKSQVKKPIYRKMKNEKTPRSKTAF